MRNKNFIFLVFIKYLLPLKYLFVTKWFNFNGIFRNRYISTAYHF